MRPWSFAVARQSRPFAFCPWTAATLDAPICADPSGWAEIAPGDYWGGADLNFVLKSGFTVPDGWNPKAIALHLPLGVLGDIFNHPEALAYVDQIPIGSADRYHHTLPLDPTLADARRHVLSLHGWTGHAGWPPDPASTAKLHMGDCNLVERDPATQKLVDTARVALDSLSEVDVGTGNAILDALDAAFRTLDTRDPLGAAFYATVADALATLKAGLAKAGPPHAATLHAIGHAHMDIAYLWPISQIRLKNARTYSNVLRLMEADETFRFSHSQPALYEMTAKDYPALFEGIKTRIKEGRWEVMGGMWVEPDLNLPGPEALVRQLTLGRSYFRDHFGEVETPVLWLPDTFGFPGQIPQLMKQAGLEWFVTNKLNWNQYNRVPWPTHLWEGIDGSRVKAHILTTPREVQYLPFPTNYKSDLTAREVMGTVTHAGAEAADALPICFGYGDGGGGPTEDLLAKAKVFTNFPGMPRLRLSTVKEALAALDGAMTDWPVWRGEHYLEGHRGVFTSQGWIKRANRRAEHALHEAEALAAMAGQRPDLTEAWKLLCLNQFHDIITGTSVGVVYDDARRDYARIAEITEAATLDAASALAMAEPAVINVAPTGGPRTVSVPENLAVPGQKTENGSLLFFKDLAPYSIAPLSSARPPDVPVTLTEEGSSIILQNAALRAEFRAGELTSVIEQTTGREIIASDQSGNRLLAFEDRPICWDAWDIDPHYEDRQEALGAPISVAIIEQGPIRAKLRLEYAWRDSRIVQDVSLSADSRRLDFHTTVDWHERHTLLKVAFPVAVTAPEAEFDIQWGKIARATGRTSSFDAARFEVPMQKWVSLSDDTLEIALMNDCKYGCDTRESELRMTLIKSATSPDPDADQGTHEFTYSLFAAPAGQDHLKNHAAYDLNRPPRVIGAAQTSNMAAGLHALQMDAENVVVETLKPSDTCDGWVVRLFECAGRATSCTLTVQGDFASASEVDFFESDLASLPFLDGNLSLELRPYQIASVLLRR